MHFVFEDTCNTQWWVCRAEGQIGSNERGLTVSLVQKQSRHWHTKAQHWSTVQSKKRFSESQEPEILQIPVVEHFSAHSRTCTSKANMA